LPMEIALPGTFIGSLDMRVGRKSACSRLVEIGTFGG